ncbi:SUMO-interacting motif-containing protein 1 isoform X1 [Arapaima gigas]
MEDVILISSGSDEDSDVEFLGVYNHGESNISSTLKTEYSRYSPTLTDFKDHRWISSQRLCRGHSPSLPVPALGNLHDGKQLGLVMGSQSPKQGLAFPEGVERMTEYTDTFTLQTHSQFPWQSTGNVLVKKDRTTPEPHCANNHFSAKTWTTKRTEQCENVRGRHLWKSHDFNNRSSIEPQSVISSQSSQSQSVSDLGDKGDFTTDFLNTMVNASYISGHPSSYMSSVSQQGSSEEVGLKTARKGESVVECKIMVLGKEKIEESMTSFPNDASVSPVSSYSSYSSYYCPSERDTFDLNDSGTQEAQSEYNYTYNHSSSPAGYVLSQDIAEGSFVHASKLGEYQVGNTNTGGTDDQFPSASQSDMACESLTDTSVGLGSGLAPSPRVPHIIGLSGPASTDILAGDPPNCLADDAELPSASLVSDNKPSPIGTLSTVTFHATGEVLLDRDGSLDEHLPSFIQEENEEVDEGTDHESDLGCMDASHQDQRYISKTQLRRLKLSMRRLPQDQTLIEVDDDDDDDDEEDDFGPREQLCPQSLSLVNSTIEENYPEGTLQLLSDFLHPRFYPPSEVMNHLLRGILLDTQCPAPLVTEAYNLLMRIQKYHPADQSTFQWDWDLLASVMNAQDKSRKHRSSVQRMLLQYVLQTLEDDFWACLVTSRLHHSIVRAMLSCDRKFSHVRDVIGWLVCAVGKSVADPAGMEAESDKEKEKERDENLQIVFLLQKMLTLAVEVDHSPTISSNKLSRELFQTLVSTVPHREHRMLLLETVENKLLRCKLLELLLEHTCPRKIQLPMSLNLILHFVHYSKPMDGTEPQQKWVDLINVIWMLLLSYEEVKESHLRHSISDRHKSNRIPIQTEYDLITPEAVQDAADAFLSQVSADLGSFLPPQLQESFLHLQDHLLEACQH